MPKITAFDAAKRKFPPGVAVFITPHAMSTTWQNALASGATPRVVDVARLHGNDDDPRVCVCCPCVGGPVCEWFLPDQLITTQVVL